LRRARSSRPTKYVNLGAEPSCGSGMGAVRRGFVFM
jgi:hypothetical protein